MGGSPAVIPPIRSACIESLKDVWQMFEIIVAERKRRELDPTVEMLRGCLNQTNVETETYTVERVTAMLDFFDAMLSFYGDLQKPPKGALPSLTRLRGKLRKLLAKGGRVQ